MVGNVWRCGFWSSYTYLHFTDIEVSNERVTYSRSGGSCLCCQGANCCFLILFIAGSLVVRWVRGQAKNTSLLIEQVS